MYKTVISIDGMMCSMCEAHVCAVIRRAFPDAKKVKASRRRGEATFLSANGIDEEKLKSIIADTGYTLLSITAEPYRKRGLFG